MVVVIVVVVVVMIVRISMIDATKKMDMKDRCSKADQTWSNAALSNIIQLWRLAQSGQTIINGGFVEFPGLGVGRWLH